VPRLKIIDLFEASKVRHLTAEDVYRQAADRGPRHRLATVYRVLTSSSRRACSCAITSNRARRVRAERGHAPRPSRLHPVRQVEEFYDAEIEKRQIKSPRDRGFAITEHALYLYAECVKPSCPTAATGEAARPYR
jgi:Fur family ferric uptake transcriptional regulator